VQGLNAPGLDDGVLELEIAGGTGVGSHNYLVAQVGRRSEKDDQFSTK
jgi:hypothetical protein